MHTEDPINVTRAVVLPRPFAVPGVVVRKRCLIDVALHDEVVHDEAVANVGHNAIYGFEAVSQIGAYAEVIMLVNR